MKRSVVKTCFSAAAVLALAIGVFGRPANATNIGTLDVGSSYSDTIKSDGPTFTRDYNFHLNSAGTQVTLLATSLSQTSPSFGVDDMTIKLFDSANNLITSATGAPIAFFDSFAKTGLSLSAGDYLFTVFGDVTAGKEAFVSVSLAANSIAGAPIPGSVLMLLTSLGVLGGFALHRRRAATGPGGLAA
jgi:hypothetical protein